MHLIYIPGCLEGTSALVYFARGRPRYRYTVADERASRLSQRQLKLMTNSQWLAKGLSCVYARFVGIVVHKR